MTRILSVVIMAFGLVLPSLTTVVRADDTVSPDLIRRVELQWEAQEKATAYEIELGTSPEFTTTLYAEKLETNKFTVDLQPGSYYYRVRAIDERKRPGRWTATQDLNINARPPKLMAPIDGTLYRGNLWDTGIEFEWRSSGMGIKYLVEVLAQDDLGNFTQVVVKEETMKTRYAFFPQQPGKFKWSVHTIGAGGDEPGPPWELAVEGVIPRNIDVPEGMTPKRVVRYVPPWWRGHWTLYARYGQSLLSYSIVDQDFLATGSFTGLTGYATFTLNWEYHDPVRTDRFDPKSFSFGIPWIDLEWENDRQTVLTESILLPRRSVRIGTWYDEWLRNWRFTPILEYSMKEIAIYQPLSPTQAVRSNSERKHLGFGIGAEYQMKSFLTLGGSVKMIMESGGLGGVHPVGGVYNVGTAVVDGAMDPATGFEFIGSGSVALGPRVKVQGRLRYEKISESWEAYFPKFPTPPGQAGPTDTHTKASYGNISFDVSVGIKF
jgi:hypothetical protein